jgi:hypothetical protein
MTLASEYAIKECAACHRTAAEFLSLTVTGRVRDSLFDWQKRTVRGRPVYGLESMHPEAEVRCDACTQTFWTISPVALEEAKGAS